MFIPTYYKSHIINHIQSPQTHELTAIVSVQKIESNLIVATNVAQVITYLHTGHHTQCTKLITNISDMFNPTYYKSHIINQIQSPQTHQIQLPRGRNERKIKFSTKKPFAIYITYLAGGKKNDDCAEIIRFLTEYAGEGENTNG